MFGALTAEARIVILHGKEAFLIGEGSRRYAETLEEAFETLQRFQLDGRTVELADVLDELRTPGLLVGHKLVVVDHADVFLAGGRRAAAQASDDEGAAGDEDEAAGTGADGQKRRRALEAYAANPCPEGSLLLRAEAWRPGRLDKAVAKVGAVIKCDLVKDREAITWCRQRAESRHDCRLEAEAARLLVERLGPDLARLDSELDKLAAYVGPGKPVGRREVADLVGLGREEKAWVLQEAILSGDPAVACSKLRELTSVSQVPYELGIWAVGDVLRRLHTAARELRAGTSAGQLRRDLRLFGPSGDMLLEAARRMDPAEVAQLLQQAVESDVATKSGIGHKDRNLEVLTLHVTDSIGCQSIGR
jgi:DNA polymerase-3 subunit delta